MAESKPTIEEKLVRAEPAENAGVVVSAIVGLLALKGVITQDEVAYWIVIGGFAPKLVTSITKYFTTKKKVPAQ